MFGFLQRLFGDPLTPYREAATAQVQALGCCPQWEEGEQPLMCGFQVASGNRTYSCRMIVASTKFITLFVDSQTEPAKFPANMHAELSQRNQKLRYGKWKLAQNYLHLTGLVQFGDLHTQAFTTVLYEMLAEAVDFDNAHDAAPLAAS